MITERFKGFDFVKLDNVIDDIRKEMNLPYLKKSIFNSGSEDIAVLKLSSNEFSMVRKFKYEAGFKIVVHDFFAMTKNHQGKGYSKKIFAELYKQYENSGVDYLEVYANIDVGGYTWARYGFKAMKESVYDTPTGMLTEAETVDFKSFIGRYKFGEYVDMFELSSKPYGKKLLMGTSWEGVLDMNDPVQVAIFKDYLGL